MQNNVEHRLASYLKQYRLITDGSFGTYYADKYQTNEMPELANCDSDKAVRERVFKIHEEYIRAGAALIRTNTFASNTVLLNTNHEGVQENIRQAVSHAMRAVRSCSDTKSCFIAGDIGPIPPGMPYKAEDAEKEYYIIGRSFIEAGIDIINFETFPDAMQILPAIKQLKADAKRENRALFVMVQFSVNQFGYSANGMSARRLLSQAAECEEIDAVGLNCGVGPVHMEQIISALDRSMLDGKYFIALPNAGYPKRVRNQIRFQNHPGYFVDKEAGLCGKCGVDIVGGCCGTTPEYIRMLAKKLDIVQRPRVKEGIQKEQKPLFVTNHAFFKDRPKGRKLIAVELAPPANANDEKLLDAAHFLADLGVDVLTFPDSPSGRTRVDSVLMAEKVHRETGMCVMPHICCRDKNAIAMRSTFLGAHINDIHNFLIITGDPVPTLIRQTTKAVFNFDSVGLMNIVRDMNEESFQAAPLIYG
ncbi:MAG: homocysteine S-methyltransferase family protein, partial [Lachnospiraceae bacterium]|nr:homocysteine S-methyltransferase family protein [Lachnospiraceae bacterium]